METLRTVAGVVFYVAIVLVFVRPRRRQWNFLTWRQRLAFRVGWSSLAKASATAAIVLLLLFALPVVNLAAESAVGAPSVEPGSDNPVVMLAGISPLVLLLAGGVVYPAAEEYIFRRCMIDRMSARKGVLFAVLASSALFAVGHLFNTGWNPSGLAVPFVSGVLLAALYLKCGLFWAIAAHGGYNTVITLMWLGGV